MFSYNKVKLIIDWILLWMSIPYMKMVLHSSGVNLDTFSAHSCQSASTSTSKAAATGVPFKMILMAGQWSTSSTFYTFYRKDIVVAGQLSGPQFASGLLTQDATWVEQIFTGIVPCTVVFILVVLRLSTLCIDLILYIFIHSNTPITPIYW